LKKAKQRKTYLIIANNEFDNGVDERLLRKWGSLLPRLRVRITSFLMLTHAIRVDISGRLLRFDGDLQLVTSLNPRINVVFVKMLAQDTGAG
jgi:hypothetical protein